MDQRLLAFGLAAAACALAACGKPAPTPSHVDSAYHGKLIDDTMVEASTSVLMTKKPVVIALNCHGLGLDAAVRNNDQRAIDDAVKTGDAARLPAGVTLYTPPFGDNNHPDAPFVVTDDKYGGTLCTLDSYDVLHQ